MTIFRHKSFADGISISGERDYIPISISILTACHMGYYKPANESGGCRLCPANSRTYEEGSVLCDCLQGFSRLPIDPDDLGCTSKPLHECENFQLRSSCGRCKRSPLILFSHLFHLKKVKVKPATLT